MVADRGVDPNTIPLNPRWGYQRQGQQSGDARMLCPVLFTASTPPPGGEAHMIVNPACTSQMPANDQPGLGVFDYSRTICAYGGGPWTGHSNWFPATYTGRVYFEDHSSAWGGDDEYTMDVTTPEGRGSLSGNGRIRGLSTVHIEFDSDETIDHFRTPWWSELHSLVDLGEGDGVQTYPQVHGFLDGSQVIVTGLFGIDWVHTPGAESHPVWALAVQVNANRWAFFVRNWGNEGFCASQNHTIGLRGGRYTFKIPWQTNASDVQILTPIIRTGWFIGGFAPNGLIVPIPGDGVYVNFVLPDPRLKPFYEGEIHLRWIYRGTPPPHKKPPACSAHVACAPSSDEPEHLLQAMFGPLLSKRQKAAIAAKLTQPSTPDRRVSKHAIDIRRAPHPLPRPRHRPTTRASKDRRLARRNQMQKTLLCGAIHLPELPAACFSPTAVINFDDRPAGTEVSTQYAARGVTFGPATSVDTRAPKIAKVGALANSGSNVLSSGSCFSAACEFGGQSLVTASFSSPHRQVGIFIGKTSSGTAPTVTLKAFDANSHLVGQKQAKLKPGAGVHRPLLLALGETSATITRVTVSAATPFGIDDFAFR